MRDRLIGITKTATFRHTSSVTMATIVNGLLGFVFYWFLARTFAPSQLGVFAVTTTAIALITDVSTVGTETGVVNFVGKFIKTDRTKALRILKLALETKIVISVLIVVLGWFTMPFIANEILAKSELVVPLRLALIGAVSGLMFGFATSSLQALQKFKVWGLLNIFSNLARLLIVIGIFFVGVMSVNATIYVYILIPFLAFLVAFFYLPPFLRVEGERELAGVFFHYNKWVAVFTIIAAVSSRLDTFLVTKLLTLSEVGIYSVAVTLSGVVPQLVGAIGTVIAPKLAGMETKEKAVNFFKKAQVFVGVLAMVGIVSGNLAGYIFITKFYGSAYLASLPVFVVLLIANCIFLFSVPVHMMVIYYFSYPKLFVVVSVVNILIISVLGYILIISFGFVGAAIAILIGNIVNFVIPAVWVSRKLKEV